MVGTAGFWADAAAGWIRQADRHDALARPLGAVAMQWLQAQPGERILDVGCGCGGTAAELAAATGPGGAVVGLDLSEAMVAAAERRFPPGHHPGLRFIAGDVETTVVSGGPFDAVFSRMTLMLLADPVASCSAISRQLRPGGRLAATVFRAGPASPWLPATVLGAAPYVGPMPSFPIGAEPGPFAFAHKAYVTKVLAAAGFAEIAVEPHDVVLRTPDDPELVAEWLIDVGPAGAVYRLASPIQQTAARLGVANLLERYRLCGSGYSLPAGIWLITAKTPLHQ